LQQSVYVLGRKLAPQYIPILDWKDAICNIRGCSGQDCDSLHVFSNPGAEFEIQFSQTAVHRLTEEKTDSRKNDSGRDENKQDPRGEKKLNDRAQRTEKRLRDEDSPLHKRPRYQDREKYYKRGSSSSPSR